jgi:arylsulfatase A-like enzyme
MKSVIAAILMAGLFASPAQAQESSSAARPHNIVIFVADGLRYGSVDRADMPNMARLKSEGVDFTNSHSLYPTVTTVNASAIATGHYIGDTGDFGNTIYTGRPMDSIKGGTLGFLENDRLLAEMNRKFGGNYLGETSLIAAARAHGWQTAIIGKEGPARIQDSTAIPDQTLILDDSSGGPNGLALPAWFEAGMKNAGLAPPPPPASVPDIAQEAWLSRAANDIVLPHLKDSGKPFILLFWSRDPDFSQHNGKDSIGSVTPGINGASGRAGIHNADTVLGQLLARLKALGLDRSTDVFVTADHGFTTLTHQDGANQLPNGFLLRDLSAALSLPQRPGMLGRDPAHPDVVVAPNGNSDLIYLPGANARDRAGAIVSFLAGQDYVSGVFVNDSLGRFRGALPMSMLNLIGSARTPQPAIYVSYKSAAGACRDRLQCTVSISDAPLDTGQGNHGGFSRAETRNFMAAIGPDFKRGFADPAPVSNADIAPTLAQLMGFALPARGKLMGRVASEALVGGKPVQVEKHRVVSEPDPDSGLSTVLEGQSVGETRYFDAAGFEGRTVGLGTGSGPNK